MLDNIKAPIERPDEWKDPFIEEEDDKHYWAYMIREGMKRKNITPSVMFWWYTGWKGLRIGRVSDRFMLIDVFACMIHEGQLQLVVLG